jgi:hypothetical protein
MSFKDPWLAKGKPSPIEFERLSFEATSNPIHLWRAYRIARELMTARPGPIVSTLPDWIFEHFDAVQDRVQEMFYRHGDGEHFNVAAEIAAVTGFKSIGQGVRSTAFSDDELARRDIGLASGVQELLRQAGVNPAEASTAQVDDAIADLLENRRAVAEAYERNGGPDDRERRRLTERATISDSTVRRAWEKWHSYLSECDATYHSYFSKSR